MLPQPSVPPVLLPQAGSPRILCGPHSVFLAVVNTSTRTSTIVCVCVRVCALSHEAMAKLKHFPPVHFLFPPAQHVFHYLQAMHVHVSVCVHVKDEEHWYVNGQKCAVSSPMLVE